MPLLHNRHALNKTRNQTIASNHAYPWHILLYFSYLVLVGGIGWGLRLRTGAHCKDFCICVDYEYYLYVPWVCDLFRCLPNHWKWRISTLTLAKPLLFVSLQTSQLLGKMWNTLPTTHRHHQGQHRDSPSSSLFIGWPGVNPNTTQPTSFSTFSLFSISTTHMHTCVRVW